MRAERRSEYLAGGAGGEGGGEGEQGMSHSFWQENFDLSLVSYGLAGVCRIIWMSRTLSIFAYCMVWWASIVGEVTGLTQSTLGITFIAAGCKVPDLVIACIVAGAGQGDVVVSSSFGSNLFDVTVGLPLPWLLALIIQVSGQCITSCAKANTYHHHPGEAAGVCTGKEQGFR